MSDILADYLKAEKTGLDFLDNPQDPLAKISNINHNLNSGNVAKRQIMDVRSSRFLKDRSIVVTVKLKGKPDEEIIIPEFSKKVPNIINRSIIFYGPTKCGKTTLMLNFMNILKKAVPNVFIFSPTNVGKHEYDKLVPRQLVFESLNLEDLERISKRQMEAANVYSVSNDINVLESLFRMVVSPSDNEALDSLLRKKDKAIREIKKNLPVEKQVEKINEIEETCKNRIIEFYKKRIAPARESLERMNLSSQQKLALKFLNFNPNVLVLFDDTTSEIENVIKEDHKRQQKSKAKGQAVEGEIVKNFFYQGRWYYISHWYAVHNETALKPEVRNNAFYSIFCEKSMATAYFQRGTNGFTPEEKKKAEAVIEAVFNPSIAPPFAKLVYIREERKFYYVVADLCSDFKMGSEALWKFCDLIDGKQNTGENNPFSQSFK